MQLAKPSAASATQKARQALDRYGLAVERIRVREHPSRRDYTQSRLEIARINVSGKAWRYLAYALQRILPAPGGYTHLQTGQANFSPNAGAVIRLHEMVHSIDANADTELRMQIMRSMDKGHVISVWRTPTRYIRFKMDEFRLTAILEGRAKYAEELASIDKEFSFWERLRFGLSVLGEATVSSGLALWALDNAADIIRKGNASRLWIPVLLAYLGVKTAVYAVGQRFLERITENTGDPKKTFDIIAAHPPSLWEMLRTRSYIQRCLED